MKKNESARRSKEILDKIRYTLIAYKISPRAIELIEQRMVKNEEIKAEYIHAVTKILEELEEICKPAQTHVDTIGTRKIQYYNMTGIKGFWEVDTYNDFKNKINKEWKKLPKYKKENHVKKTSTKKGKKSSGSNDTA